MDKWDQEIAQLKLAIEEMKRAQEKEKKDLPIGLSGKVTKEQADVISGILQVQEDSELSDNPDIRDVQKSVQISKHAYSISPHSDVKF